MIAKAKWLGLAIAGVMAAGGVQAADQRFQTQIDTEQARADIVERAAGEAPETVRSGSGVWGTHSPINNWIAISAVGVINEGAAAVLDQLKTTQEELAQTQVALQSTQAALQVAQSDLQATQSASADFQKAVTGELARLQNEIEKAGGSGGQITTKEKSKATTYYYDYGAGDYVDAQWNVGRVVGYCSVQYLNGVPIGGSITRWSINHSYSTGSTGSNSRWWDIPAQELPPHNGQASAKSWLSSQCAMGRF